MTGAFPVYATAWLSLALWAAGEWRRRRPLENARGRALFTAALVVMVAHSALAFGVLHGWSHAEALLHAARRTQEVTGTAAPRGFYANHAFLAFWTIEAAAWWLRADAYRARDRAKARARRRERRAALDALVERELATNGADVT